MRHYRPNGSYSQASAYRRDQWQRDQDDLAYAAYVDSLPRNPDCANCGSAESGVRPQADGRRFCNRCHEDEARARFVAATDACPQCDGRGAWRLAVGDERLGRYETHYCGRCAGTGRVRKGAAS